MKEETVGDAVLGAIEEENYSAVRGFLLEYGKGISRTGRSNTLVGRLLDRLPDALLAEVIGDLDDENESTMLLVVRVMKWQDAYLRLLEG